MEGLPVSYKPMSASGVVKARGGEFYGLICNTTTSGVVTFYDHEVSASGNVIMGPITLVAGQPVILNSLAVRCARGIYMRLDSGVAQLNVLFS